jgi:hypothetical protein
MIALLILLLQAPVGQPPPNADLLVAVQALSTIAGLYGTTPYCYLTPKATTPTCQPAMAARDVTFVQSECRKALTAMKAYPATQRQVVDSLLTRLSQQLGSTGYERLAIYVQAMRPLVITPATTVKLGPDGKPLKDDQP